MNRSQIRGRWVTCVALLMLLASGILAGCVERTLSLTSEPKGALVFLNDQEVGRTPVTVPFTFYGTYSVRLEREDYLPMSTQRKAVAPWWETPGIDLFAELIPNNQVELAWHFNLNEAGEADPDKVINRASQLRAMLRKDSPELDTKVVEPTQATPATPAGQ